VQVDRFLALRGWDYRPDLVIVYCGNNDASLSGPWTDRELIERQRFRTARAALSHLATYRLLRGFLQRGRVKDDSAEPVVRVSPEEYEIDLRSIITQCRTHDCPVIILKPPVPRLWPAGLQFKPFLQLTGTDGRVIVPDRMATVLKQPISYCLDAERFKQLYGRGDIFTRAVFLSASTDTLPPEQAMEYHREQADRQPDDPVAVNNLGVAWWRMGRYDDADCALHRAREIFTQAHARDTAPSVYAAGSPFLYNLGINLLSAASGDTNTSFDTTTVAYAYLDSALQADYFSLRTKRPYWEAIDRLAREPGVTVIDLPRIFRENGGERLFFDHCHPTAEGHRLIAQAIVRALTSHGW
jgi:lysophospholipase L1-like esterase